jgi:hypothetical protein
MFLGQGLLLQPLLEHISSLKSAEPQDTSSNSSTLSAHIQSLRHKISEAGMASSSETLGADTDIQLNSNGKRMRTEDESKPLKASPSPPAYIQSDNSEWGLPPPDLIDSLVGIYFATIHPWIPILHVRGFREQMRDPAKRPDLSTIFHAIVSVCVRFSTDPRVSDPDIRARYSKCSRQMVILQSMEAFSVRNLQAMIIIAFDSVCASH